MISLPRTFGAAIAAVDTVGFGAVACAMGNNMIHGNATENIGALTPIAAK